MNSDWGIDLFWIPLGAGGSGFVRFNGRVYERMSAWRRGRRPLDLYHTSLRVAVPEGSYIVETMWPSPVGDPSDRGVVVQAPVFSRRLASARLFRYEVRRWNDGDLQDASEAVGGPRRVVTGSGPAIRLLGLVASVPPLVWGRDECRTGDMWNSNSVISWLLTKSGADIDGIRPPRGGRAPGWVAGVSVARSARRGARSPL